MLTSRAGVFQDTLLGCRNITIARRQISFSCMLQRIPLLWRGHEPQSLTQLLLHGRHTIQILALHGTGRSYTATAAEGPPRDKVTGLPFTVSPSEADEAYDGFHSTANRVLTAQPAARVGKKESYLPFWICRAEVRIRGAS